MGSPFDGQQLTKTRSNTAGNDKQSPQLGSLNVKAMTSVSALAGTTGTDVCLIHGDRWEQLEGNETINLLHNNLLTISGNRTETVKQNEKVTIVGTTTTMFIGVHNQTNIAPRNDTFMHTRTEDHHQPEQIHQPTQQLNIQQVIAEYFEHHTKFSSWFFTMVGIKMEVTPIVSLGFATLEGKLGVIGTKALFLSAQSKDLDAKFQKWATKVSMTTILASFLWAKVIAFDGNAGIAANADSPFA